MKVLDEQTDISAQLKQAWKADNAQEMQNFMVCLVLVCAKTCFIFFSTLKSYSNTIRRLFSLPLSISATLENNNSKT